MRVMMKLWATVALTTTLLGACATAATSPIASAEPAPTIATDPFASQRPTAAGAGVMQPSQFARGSWINGSYIEHVTQFAILPSRPGGIAMVGDSITDGFRWSEAFPDENIRNWGIGGDTSFGLLGRADQIIATRPAKIFILIGTNDLASYEQTPTDVAGNVSALVTRFKAELPTAEIYLQSVMPRQPEFRQRIETLNAQLAAIAAAKGAKYIDIYTPLLSGDRLNPAYTIDDLHLTGQGYQRWLSVIGGCVTGDGPCE